MAEIMGSLLNILLRIVDFFLSPQNLVAQMDLDLEVIWQERVRRLEEVSSMTPAVRNLLVRPIKAFNRDLKRLRHDPDGFAIDALQRA